MRTYTGDQTSSIAIAMNKCDPLGPLMINVVKLYSTPDGQAFTALGRVYSGAIRTGQRVKVGWQAVCWGARGGRGGTHIMHRRGRKAVDLGREGGCIHCLRRDSEYISMFGMQSAF